MSRAFFDSNVLIYAYGRADPRKSAAQALLTGGGVISVQCLNEFAAVSRGKIGMPWATLTEAIELIISLVDRVLPIGMAIHQNGRRLAERNQLSIYDGMIVAAALAADCDILYSEDMHDGLLVDGRLTIVNPFA